MLDLGLLKYKDENKIFRERMRKQKQENYIIFEDFRT